MKFSSIEERDSLIKGFEENCKALTQKYKDSIPKKTEVSFETMTFFDRELNPLTGLPDDIFEDLPLQDGEEVPQKRLLPNPGELLVCYIKQPHLVTSTQIMDKLVKLGDFQAGLFAFDAMVLSPESSPEINDHENKFGICWRLAKLLSIKLPDFKKK